MPSKYIVCQFGNVMTGEYLNIGVYTYDIDPDKQKVFCRFLTNWTRINAAFGQTGDKNADTILSDLIDSWLTKIETKDKLLEDIKNSYSPYSSLLFTEPRASLLPADQLLDDVAKTFLVE